MYRNKLDETSFQLDLAYGDLNFLTKNLLLCTWSETLVTDPGTGILIQILRAFRLS